MKMIFAAALIAALLISCDFIGTDMFPRELQYAAGGYDLASELGIEPDKIGELRIERLISKEGVSGVFVVAKRPDGWRLFIFDEGMKQIRVLQDSNFSRFLGSGSVTNNNSFTCGKSSISSEFQITGSGSQQGCTDGATDIATSDWVITQDDNKGYTQILCFPKNGINPLPLVTIIDGSLANILDSSVLSIASGDARPYLLYKFYSGVFVGVAAIDLGGMSNIPYLSNMNPLTANESVRMTMMHLEDIDGGWITEDGIVVLSHYKDTKLIRFDLTSGAELDSIKIKSEWMQGLSFEDSGEHWYYYDRRTGYLKKLRTWWQ